MTLPFEAAILLSTLIEIGHLNDIINNQAIPRLLSLLSSSSSVENIQQTLLTLTKIYENSVENRDIVLSYGFLSHIFTLSQNYSNILEQLTFAVLKLFSMKPFPELNDIVSILSFLSYVLSQSDPRSSIYVFDILTLLSEDIQNLDYILESNIISTIFSILSTTEQYTLIESNVQCLQIILNGTSYHRKFLLQMNILPLFKSIFDRKDKYLVGISMAQCLLIIITKESEYIDTILELKLIKDLIGVGCNLHSFLCVLEIIQLLNHQNIHFISDANLGVYLCGLFDKPFIESEIICRVLNTIYFILKININFKSEISGKHLKHIYNLWKTSEDKNLSESAGQICQLLSLLEDEEGNIDMNIDNKLTQTFQKLIE